MTMHKETVTFPLSRLIAISQLLLKNRIILNPSELTAENSSDYPGSATSYAMILSAEQQAAQRNRQNLRDIFIFVCGESKEEANEIQAIFSDARVEAALGRWRSGPVYCGTGEFRPAIGNRIPYRGVNGEVEWHT